MALVGMNALVFLYQLALPSGELEAFIARSGLVPARVSELAIVSSMFLHVGPGHLAGNLFFLWIFGGNVEDRLGHARFLLFYLAAGVLAATVQITMDPASTVPIVGASGAVAGVMGAYFRLFPQSRILTLLPCPPMLFEIPAVFFLGLWFVIQLASGPGPLFGPPGGTAFWAHGMAFLMGLALVRAVGLPERNRVEWWSP